MAKISRKEYEQRRLTPIGIDIARIFEKRFLEIEKELKEIQPDWSPWDIRDFLQTCISSVILRDEVMKEVYKK